MPSLSEMKEASIRRAIGPTILLGSGNYFDFEDPEHSEITIEDIAYGLAFESRFSGQCVSRLTGKRCFYGVGEHCIRMSYAVPPEHALAALMHEAGEAPCGDMTGPLKSICADYKAVEKRCERAILSSFGVTISDPDLIKLYDLRMLATERRDLLNWRGERWGKGDGAEPFEFVIEPWPMQQVAERFISRFHDLRGGVAA